MKFTSTFQFNKFLIEQLLLFNNSQSLKLRKSFINFFSCCLIVFAFLQSTTVANAQCTTPACLATTAENGANGPDPCDAKLYCSNSGAVQSGLIACTNAADTDGCGVSADASHSAVSQYATADAEVTALFSSNDCDTGTYLQWIVFATPPTVKGTRIQGVGAVDSWWIFYAGSVTIDPNGQCGNADPTAPWYDADCQYNYPTVAIALKDPARCNSFNSSDKVVCTDANQWETWVNDDAAIGENIYNIYYIGLFWDKPTNGSLNFKVKECEIEDCPSFVTLCPSDVNEGSCQTQMAINTKFNTWLDGFSASGGDADASVEWFVDGESRGSTKPTVADAPSACGGDVTVKYTITDGCNMPFTCEKTFTVAAADAVDVAGPADNETEACAYADDAALQAAYSAWLLEFTTLENGCGDDGAFTTTPPMAASLSICSDVDITLTYSADDGCTKDTVSASFSAAADTVAPEIELPEVTLECNESFPATLTANWTDNCADGETITVGPSNITSDGCNEYADYVFQVTDDCENPAEATLKVQRSIEDELENCETAFARDPETNSCFIPDFNRWGWTNYYEDEGIYILDLYAGAAHCDISNRTPVGTVTVDYNGGEVTITYNINSGFTMSEAHVYVGCEMYPRKNGSFTVAPGQYNFNPSDLGSVSNFTVGPIAVEGPIYVIAHAVVCEQECSCSVSENEGGTYSPSNNTIDCGDSVPTGPTSIIGRARLFSLFPNPFDREINVKYEYDFDTEVKIEIFDLHGIIVRTYENKNYTKGSIENVKIDLWNALDKFLFVRISSEYGSEVKKIVSTNKK